MCLFIYWNLYLFKEPKRRRGRESQVNRNRNIEAIIYIYIKSTMYTVIINFNIFPRLLNTHK
jgi:hypothetical protein